MKNIFKSIMCIAAAAMAFTACSTADINEEITTPQTITVKFNALAENTTRTTFGVYDSTNKEYPTLWVADDKVKASLGVGNGATSKKLTEGGQNASFEIEFNANTIPAEGPYTLYAVSPSSAVTSPTLEDGNKFNITIPTTQTPTPESCDAAAQILYGKSAESANIPTNASFTLHHAVAYIYFSLSNLPAEATTINNIVISSESNIAGKYTLAFDGTLTDNSASNSITVTTDSATDNWVALAPGAVEALTFTVSTNAGVIEKTVNIPDGKSFVAGKIAGFTVDMSGAATEDTVKYELLTDVEKLAIGDYVIIAAANAEYAIGEQGKNNRTATTVTKDGKYIVNPSSSVEIFTVGEGNVEKVGEGNVEKTYSLQNKGDGKYIYAASNSSNYLRSEEELSDNSSWAITVTNTGVATIKAQGVYTHNTIRYNGSNNPKIFSCYASGQQDVAIYYKSNGGVVPPKTPVINAENPEAVAADVTTIEIPYTVSNPVDDKELTVTKSVDWVTAVAVDNEKVTLTITANESEEPREATITLSYEDATDKVVTISQEGVYVAPEPGTGTTYYLTNAEILTAVNTGNGYADISISSESGTWSGHVYCATNVKYLQLRNRNNAQLTSPEFSSNIKSISFTINSSSTANRTLYIVSPDATFPSDNTTYSTTNILKTNYGSVAATVGQTVTIEPTSDIKQFMLVVQGGAIYINDITVVCE